jgi:Dolichyl-phosphate-mannose-protein mannosyltransferase
MTGLISRNRLFTVVLIAAALLRIDAELGYRWQSWFNDSWDYMDTAVTLNLDPTRTSGYGLYLFLLKPFHSLALVTISQHLMGLAVAVMMYALAKRRFRAPSWLAVLMTLPVLFDGFEIQLEHLVLSDTLFLFLVMLATMILLWSPLRPSRSTWLRCLAAGVLIGVSALVRSTGVPLVPVFGLWVLLALALNRVGWRALIASVAAFAVTAVAPSVCYAGWYDLQHGQFNTGENLGVFLYSRVMTFAECSKMQPMPTYLLALCTAVPPDQRPIAQAYIWTSASPLDRFPPSKFSPRPNSLALQFAIRAIEAQPLDYLRVTFDDSWRAFDWPRTVFPNPATYDEYLFEYRPLSVSSAHPADGYRSSAQAYLAGGNPSTVVVNPFAGLIRTYQRYIWLPGTGYGLILLVGLAGLVVAWRRRGAAADPDGGPANRGNDGLAALLPWACSLTLIVAPAATSEFDYRYVTTAVPFACLAVAVAFGRTGSAGSWLAGVRLRRSGGAPVSEAVPKAATEPADSADSPDEPGVPELAQPSEAGPGTPD